MFIASTSIYAARNTIMHNDMCKPTNAPEMIKTVVITVVHWNILMNMMRMEKAFITWACPRYHFQY